MNNSLVKKLTSRSPGICLYGFAPPKQATPPEQLEAIVAQHVVRLGSLPVDGLIIYDIQDETERISTPAAISLFAYPESRGLRSSAPWMSYRA